VSILPHRLLLVASIVAAMCAGRPALAAGEAAPAPAYPPPLPPAEAGTGHWLTPLLAAARAAALGQPLVVRAERELRRAALVESQVLARWNPELTLGTNLDENRRVSTSFIDGFGVVRDRNTVASAGLGNTFSTGTTVRLEASSAQALTSSAQALNDEYYNSTVRLVVNQALLQGASMVANRADLYTALDQAESAREARDEQLEAQFLALGEEWLTLAGSEMEVGHRRWQLEAVRRSLAQTEERIRQGLGRTLDAFSLRRDLAAQEAALATAERTLAATLERLRVGWEGLALPDRAGLQRAIAPPLAPPLSYADTRGGRGTLRTIQIAARTVTVAESGALDRLDLTASFGKNGTDPGLKQSWSEVSDPETYRWALGLTYVHRFGSDVERVERIRAVLALDQAKLQGQSDERTWRTQALTQRQALVDAVARVGELEKVYEAFREEYRLTKAQVEAGLMAMRDLIALDNQLTSALLSVTQARIDALRADLRLRAQEDRLLELLPK
jgi:outer membrane protein TolC